jgi:hypothetical protein
MKIAIITIPKTTNYPILYSELGNLRLLGKSTLLAAVIEEIGTTLFVFSIFFSSLNFASLPHLENLFIDGNDVTGVAPVELCDLRSDAVLEKFIADCAGQGFACAFATCCTFCRI